MAAPFIEADCVFEHNGHAFESGGALIANGYAVGYVRGLEDDGQCTRIGGVRAPHWRSTAVLTTWHGDRVIGRIVGAQSWRTSRSHVASHMWQVTAVIDGRRYTGRTCGDGMVWQGRLTAAESRKGNDAS